MKPRKYQQDAIDAVLGEMRAGKPRASLVLPTGAGKTVVFAFLMKAIHDEKPDARFLVIAHRGELLDQAAEKIRLITGLTVGTVKAELDETDAQVVVASVQTIVSPERFERLGAFDLTVFDECHHYAAPSYRAVVDRCDGFVLGVTATMSRSDGKALGKVWPEPCYERDILWMMRMGYLCDIEPYTVSVNDLDLSGVSTVAGDFGEKALADAMLKSGAAGEAVTAWLARAGGASTVAFCPDTRVAADLAETFRAAAVTAECVTGKTTPDERRAMYQRHADGVTTVLTSCMVLTEGWDAPHTTCALLLRPTKSDGLFVQMIGRVLRLFVGKARALLLDVTGAAEEMSLASATRLAGLDKLGLTVRDGETMMEAIERAEPERKKASRTLRLDLFRNSRSLWAKSRSGVWYMPAQTCFVFVEPSGDGYRVARTQTPYRRGKVEYLSKELDIEFAMEVAEDKARELSPDVDVSGKVASWRRGGTPSDKQVVLLLRLYPKATERDARALSKGRAAELITQAYAERCFR